MATEKICANTECPLPGRKFARTSSKASTCSLKCKNRKNYLLYQKEFAYEIKWKKAFDRNIAVLGLLYARELNEVPEETLSALGFDFSVGDISTDIEPGPFKAAYGIYSLQSAVRADRFIITISYSKK
jgi:hypothetical protein